MKFKIDFTLGIFLFAAFYLFGIILNYLSHPLEAWFKGFSTLFLILPLVFHRGALTKSLQATMIVALVFCAVGDFALVIRSFEPYTVYNDALFQVGLASYLVGYLAIGITLIISGTLDKITYAVFGIISAISLAQFYFLENVGDLIIPVVLYLFQASLLVTAAFAFRNRIAGPQKYFIIVAAIIIYISDSYIGHSTFSTEEIPFAETIITFTYYFRADFPYWRADNAGETRPQRGGWRTR
jgi:hypothetical protein